MKYDLPEEEGDVVTVTLVNGDELEGKCVSIQHFDDDGGVAWEFGFTDEDRYQVVGYKNGNTRMFELEPVEVGRVEEVR